MTIYILLAFIAGLACMYACQAYREHKNAAGVRAQRGGGSAEE